ncbi:putative quinol monooxygenase [Pseudomonas syringae USA007]|uniref:Quinol monooxygenase n=1 Tax=Pseudomonas syringae USA007 TaxID=1357288 RepID=A0AAU8MGD7_PSESX|nr:putative quinol monooxygenase [Pseudomonas syringae]
MSDKSHATESTFQADPGDKGRMPLIRIAQIQVDPDQLEQYRDASRHIVEESVAQEQGVLAFYALERRDLPGGFFVVEIYRDDQAYLSHLETESFRHYKAAVGGIVQSLELIDVDVVALATKPLNL